MPIELIELYTVWNEIDEITVKIFSDNLFEITKKLLANLNGLQWHTITVEDVNLLFNLKKHYMEKNGKLDPDLDYETYSKLCNIYKLSKKTKKYFNVDN